MRSARASWAGNVQKCFHPVCAPMPPRVQHRILSTRPPVRRTRGEILNDTEGPFPNNTVAAMDVKYYLHGVEVFPCTSVLNVLFAHVAYEIHGEYGGQAWPALKVRLRQPRVFASLFRDECKARLMGVQDYATARAVAEVARAVFCAAFARVLGAPGFTLDFVNFTVDNIHATFEMPCFVDITKPAMAERLGCFRDDVLTLRHWPLPATPEYPPCTILVCPWGKHPLTAVRSMEAACKSTVRVTLGLYDFCVEGTRG